MHIVFVSREYGNTSLRRGGIASYIKEIGSGLIAIGHKVTVICASDDTRLEFTENENGINIFRLSGGDFIIPVLEPKFSTFKKFRVFYRFYSYRKKIKRKLQSLTDVDIIEVAEFGAEALFLNNIKIPVLCRLQTPSLLDRSTAKFRKFNFKLLPEYWVGLHENYLIKQSKHISSCSDSLKNWCVKYLKINEVFIKTIYNPINLKTWDNIPDNLKKNNNSILFVGTVAEGKGIKDLIDACTILNKEKNYVTLKIVGDCGDYGKNLERKVLINGYEWCSFLGQINHCDLEKIYKENIISCFPSWWEAMGLVCTEAMYSGSIVIGSNSGGMSEIITEGIDGFLIEPKKPDLLAQKIKAILSLSDEQKLIVINNAKNTVQSRFSNEVIIDQMINYYLNIINSGK